MTHPFVLAEMIAVERERAAVAEANCRALTIALDTLRAENARLRRAATGARQALRVLLGLDPPPAGVPERDDTDVFPTKADWYAVSLALDELDAALEGR